MSAVTTGPATVNTLPEAMPLGETARVRMARCLATPMTAASGPSKASAAQLRARVAMALAVMITRFMARATDRTRARVPTEMPTEMPAETTAGTPDRIPSASPSTPCPTVAKALKHRANPPSSAPSKTMAACDCPS